MTIRLSQRQRHYDAACRIVYMMMMIVATLLLLLCNSNINVASAAASSSSFQPDISVGIRRDNNNDSISLLLEPTVRWTTTGSTKDDSIKYEGGVIIRGEQDGTIPCTIFGQISKQVNKKWNIKAKFDTSSVKIQKIKYDTSITGGPTNIQMNCNGNIDLDADNTNDIINVNKIQVKQSFGNLKKSQLLTISPSYIVSSKSTDLTLSYRIKDTTFNVDSNNIIQNKLQNNKYTLKQQLNSESTIASSIRSNIDDIDFEYKHSILDGIGTIYYKPNNNIKIQYNDDLWEACMIAPIITTNNKGLFGIKKTIDTDRIQISIRRNIS